MVPHKDAVPTPSKSITGVPGREKQKGKESKEKDDRPRHREPAGKLGNEKQKRHKASECRGDPQFDPEPASLKSPKGIP
ncbi:hypothetical protein P7K49_039810 [Saguinus oedipus]|uniref:Uncharacterized protein n=1 Tax=Saguinus oedipus TaxID=9490 RepID=A0ABQ9TC78_SAGOE|nr:hypothetical protein P7K49_039810 [Saguinus oedipus]